MSRYKEMFVHVFKCNSSKWSPVKKSCDFSRIFKRKFNHPEGLSRIKSNVKNAQETKKYIYSCVGFAHDSSKVLLCGKPEVFLLVYYGDD